MRKLRECEKNICVKNIRVRKFVFTPFDPCSNSVRGGGDGSRRRVCNSLLIPRVSICVASRSW